MAFLFRAIRRNVGLVASVSIGGAMGFYFSARNINDVQLVVNKDTVEISEHDGQQQLHVEQKLRLLSLLPLRTCSRIFGYFADVELPKFILRPILDKFVRDYNVNLNEAVDPDLSNYKTVGSFFNRDIKIDECRKFDNGADLISPCDGKILALGRVQPGDPESAHLKVEQVKGVSFSLTSFLGSPFSYFPSFTKKLKNNEVSDSTQSDVFFCTIYLAPGDYHGFVTPANWEISERRHFSGRLFSVKPSLAEIVKPLFTLNERVLYTGMWKNGFFSLTAVGATNVGFIEIDFDKDLKTNQRVKYHRPYSRLKFLKQEDSTSRYSFKLGDVFGRFRLGSTIVLIFEAPGSAKFAVKPGEKVLIGQSLLSNS